MHLGARNAAPHAVQHITRRGAQLSHAEDTGRLQPLQHAFANALHVLQLQGVQPLGQLGLFNHHQPIGLLHVRRQLGQQRVGRNADRAAKANPHAAQHLFFDAFGNRHGFAALAPATRQLAFHLVNRQHLPHGRHALYGSNRAVVKLHIHRMVRFNKHNLGAQAFGIHHGGAGFDAKGFGLVAGSNTAGGGRHDGQHAHRLAAQVRFDLLFDGRKVRVEIDKKTAEHGGNRLK